MTFIFSNVRSVTVRLPAMIMKLCTGPQTPDKFRMYHNLVAAPAFQIMIGPSATIFLETLFVIQGLLLVQFMLGLGFQLGRQLGRSLPAQMPPRTIVTA
jgi:hypothetical protein